VIAVSVALGPASTAPARLTLSVWGIQQGYQRFLAGVKTTLATRGRGFQLFARNRHRSRNFTLDGFADGSQRSGGSVTVGGRPPNAAQRTGDRPTGLASEIEKHFLVLRCRPFDQRHAVRSNRTCRCRFRSRPAPKLGILSHPAVPSAAIKKPFTPAVRRHVFEAARLICDVFRHCSPPLILWACATVSHRP